MDSALRIRFLELLSIDIETTGREPYWPGEEQHPNGFKWWPIYRRWWTGRDPRPVVRT